MFGWFVEVDTVIDFAVDHGMQKEEIITVAASKEFNSSFFFKKLNYCPITKYDQKHVQNK